jgi:hypothetical protein
MVNRIKQVTMGGKRYMTDLNILQDINEAIRQAVKDAKQDDVLANRIISWFNGISNGNETLEDHATVRNRMELLLESVIPETEEVP